MLYKRPARGTTNLAFFKPWPTEIRRPISSLSPCCRMVPSPYPFPSPTFHSQRVVRYFRKLHIPWYTMVYHGMCIHGVYHGMWMPGWTTNVVFVYGERCGQIPYPCPGKSQSEKKSRLKLRHLWCFKMQISL